MKIGQTNLHLEEKEITNNLVQLEGEEFYKIENVDHMEPFFMTIVSSSDHWMFISSNGALTAGRKNESNPLFPYYSDDKITQSAEITGSKSIFRVNGRDLWEPFSDRFSGLYDITRSLYKNKFGSRIIFEEINHDLDLLFRYSWQFSEKYGFVKKSELKNLGGEATEVEILDGIQNLMPYGVNEMLQSIRSNLANGYKRNVLDEKSQIGVFTLSAMIVDRAEPSEALKATTVWSSGLDSAKILLSSTQLDNYRAGKPLSAENDVKGVSGSFFINTTEKLPANSEITWHTVAEINQDHADLDDLAEAKTSDLNGLMQSLEKDVKLTAEALVKLINKADGLQLSADDMACGRHASNVLFNIMRGGIFDEDYRVEVADYLDYLKTINKKAYQKHSHAFEKLDSINYSELLEKSNEIGDPDLIRISYEYLPLTFSRRHGDPSRPWNRFNIDLKNEDGSKKRSYEGNWRDIFQNWEALAYSFPNYTLGMIFKFLNASTIDGYNPYRISRSGIDWELIEPDDPWSYIGYWGDHQIIYLQKLLECAEKHNGSLADEWFNKSLFVYANVPYDIKSYDDIVSDPQDTISFNESKQELIEMKVGELGADGRMIVTNNTLVRGTMMEKLLVTLLAKLSNFVPEAGIWLNTQRPEWNDANNALVGNGTSMVTLYYMRRFCSFLMDELKNSTHNDFNVHSEVTNLFNALLEVFNEHHGSLSNSFDDKTRKEIVDELGHAGEIYREKAYQGFGGRTHSISKDELIKFLSVVLDFIDHSIRHNKREDGLYHAYNIITFDGEELHVDYLYEMLEGQVAVLSSGYLSAAETLSVLNALKASDMFREDQFSYFLYPNRNIPHFLQKNTLPKDIVKKSDLIQKMKSEDDRRLVTVSKNGACHFNGKINNARDIVKILDNLEESYGDLVKKDRKTILDTFEEMFDHKSYTGRSGTFFAFEGLGSIYWHMVSKLLLATQESIYRTWDKMSDKEHAALVQHYYEIRAGIGINKNPELYGAYPTDPYSHTPFHKGAQQPGMTGQVKEDILNRWAELGVVVEEECVKFEPLFLNPQEYLSEEHEFKYYCLKDHKKSIELHSKQLAFMYCQVPVIYSQGEKKGIKITHASGEVEERDGHQLTKEESHELFSRSNSIVRIDVNFTAG